MTRVLTPEGAEFLISF